MSLSFFLSFTLSDFPRKQAVQEAELLVSGQLYVHFWELALLSPSLFIFVFQLLIFQIILTGFLPQSLEDSFLFR